MAARQTLCELIRLTDQWIAFHANVWTARLCP